MASFKYFAKRQVKSGHSLGVEYTITVDLKAHDGLLPQPVKTVNTALNGNVVTVLNRIETIYSFETVLIPISGGTYDLDDFIEFFASVAGGEQFTFNDGSDQDAIIKTYSSPRRVEGLYFLYNFSIRLL